MVNFCYIIYFSFCVGDKGENFDVIFDDKKYDFDRVVLFVNLIWLKSIDFTDVLSDFVIGFWWFVR